MVTQKQLPRGIRNNNPGNLRRAVVADTQSEVIAGFAVFRSKEDGLLNMATLLKNYYVHYGLKTVAGIITRWAPETENDTLAYVRLVGLRMAVPPGGEKTVDLRLNDAWRMIDMMRAITLVECGHPSTGFNCGGEWFNAVELWNAAAKVLQI